jgi:hypothetical protein
MSSDVERDGRRDVGTAAGASFVPWTVNALMSKNRINPPASMIFDRTKLAAAGAWPRLCNYRSNLVVGDFGLRLPDEVLATVSDVTEVRLAGQLGTLDEAHQRLIAKCLAHELPPKRWTPLLSSFWSRKVFYGYGTSSISG